MAPKNDPKDSDLYDANKHVAIHLSIYINNLFFMWGKADFSSSIIEIQFF